jgi:hypothetical protein
MPATLTSMGCYRCGSTEGDEGKLCPTCHQQMNDRRSARAAARVAESSEADSSFLSNSRSLGMLSVVMLVVVIGATTLFFLAPSTGVSSKPAVTEIENVVREYLISRSSCLGGSVTLEGYNVTSVGDFVDQMGGFPVYASYLSRCVKPGSTITYDGTKHKEAAAAFVRKTGAGSYQAFTPQIFESAEKEIRAEMEKAFSKIKMK